MYATFACVTLFFSDNYFIYAEFTVAGCFISNLLFVQSVDEILLFSVVSQTRVGPLNQWKFG